MSIFSFTNYKAYVRDRIQNLPRKGRGEVARIAQAMAVHPTLVSQVLRGDKDFTLEQAHALTETLSLVGSETDYFVTMVQFERAGTKKLKDYFGLRLKALREDHAHLGRRIETGRELSDEEKARYYSDWVYSGIRLLTAISEHNNQDRIAYALNLPMDKVASVLRFLTKTGLLIEQGGRYKLGEQSTFVPTDSPYVRQHHVNWRLKSIEHASILQAKELMFTCPVTLTESEFAKFREQLVEFIKRFYETSNQYRSQRLACLNIDWFFIL